MLGLSAAVPWLGCAVSVQSGRLSIDRLASDRVIGQYPFTLPVVRHLAREGGLELDPAVTFLVGANGTGKSTLVEALVVAAGFNAEGLVQLGDGEVEVVDPADGQLRRERACDEDRNTILSRG